MKTAPIFISIVIIVQICFLFCSCDYFSPTELTTASPNKTYKVYMVEKEEGGWDFLVYFSVEKQERNLIKDRIFYHNSGKFIGLKVEPIWTQENVLTFGVMNPSVNPDQISVVNQTKKIIRYLKITAGSDPFLLLELPPNTKTQLLAYPQTDKLGDLSWINSIGMFDDGREIPVTGMNFRIGGKYTGPAHYCVVVKENEVMVQSKEFEGYLDKDIPEAKNPSCQ